MKYLINNNMRIIKILSIIILMLVPFSCNSKKADKTADIQLSNKTNTGLTPITKVVGLGKIEPETKILSLASSGGGIITGILKSSGDRVKAGETIIVRDSETERNNLELIRNRIKTQESQVDLDRYTIRESELRLANKKRLLERSRELLKNGAETSQNLDDLETDVMVLEAGLLKNRASLTISESKLKEFRTELRKAEIDLERRNLRAPVDGTILNIMVTTGSSISQFSEFCEFAPDGKTIARCEIDEMFADRVKEGQNAEITLVGNTDVIATGKVIRTAPYLKRKSLFSELPGDREDRRVREVWIMLDNNTGLLFNLQVECIITI